MTPCIRVNVERNRIAPPQRSLFRRVLRWLGGL
jgi:hypothetical protein